MTPRKKGNYDNAIAGKYADATGSIYNDVTTSNYDWAATIAPCHCLKELQQLLRKMTQNVNAIWHVSKNFSKHLERSSLGTSDEASCRSVARDFQLKLWAVNLHAGRCDRGDHFRALLVLRLHSDFQKWRIELSFRLFLFFLSKHRSSRSKFFIRVCSVVRCFRG